MCGIAGIYKYHSPNTHSSEDNLRRMLSVIRHRGPDETGIYLGNNIGLGSVRLSIVDLSTGQQPLSDESENYWIVYNGEVFNYPELRSALEKKGVKFKTQCDTEVVVQMYAEYGADCLRYFNGQFAFCIWDKAKQELFLARDRVGIRPLFYWSEGEAFAFCSEIKGLFTLDRIPKAIKPESMAQIFTFWSALTPNTVFENIYELPPGHHMMVKNGNVKIEKYWSMNFNVDGNQETKSISSTAAEFEELFKDAIKIRLRADVQVGAYLSGGLDSSLTTAYIHEIDPGVLNTFSIGFKDKAFDETKFQQDVSKKFDTKHAAFECSSEDIAENFADTIWHTESPILRTSPTPMFMLSKKVREQNIKVVITGEGADEIFAGYNIFKEAKIRRFWANQPDSKFRPQLLSTLYKYLPMMKSSNNLALKMFFGYKLNETSNPLYSHLLRWHNTSRIITYFSDDYLSALENYAPLNDVTASLPDDFTSWSYLAQSQYLESTVFMSGYLLSSQGDRVAMGNSVEGRYPFLDYRVIEYASKLPDRYKLNCLNEKFILKKMGAGKIPESILNRSKQAYRAPIGSSFVKNKNLPDDIAEIIDPKCIKDYGVFNPEKVSSLFSKLKNQDVMSEIDQMAVVAIISTQLVCKMFLTHYTPKTTDNLLNVKIVNEV
jgi:asparagine synthase (glutamine-hydrolysing)